MSSFWYVACPIFAIGFFTGVLFGHIFPVYNMSSTTCPLNQSILQPVAISETTACAHHPPEIGYSPLGPEFTERPWWEEFDGNRTLYVAPYTAMANTLQAMGSALTIAYRHKINIQFIFYPPWFGPATWEDLFSFPVINFTRTFPDGERSIHKTKSCKYGSPPFNWQTAELEWGPNPEGPGEIGCVTTCCWREPPFPQTILWFYKILRPALVLQKLIDQFKQQNDWDNYQWVGVHIRRTDNIETMQKLMQYMRVPELRAAMNTSTAESMLPIQNYVMLMQDLAERWPIHDVGPYQVVKPIRFFLATDKDDIKSLVIKQFEESRVIFYEKGMNSEYLRSEVWGMQLGIIDLFLLASCSVVIGTPFSTFSEAATYIGDFGHLLVYVYMVLVPRCRPLHKCCARRSRPRMIPSKAPSAALEFRSVFDLARVKPLRLDAFDQIFDVHGSEGSCSVGEALSKKYDVPTENRQFVMSLRNKFSHEQTWFNAERGKKPHSFTEKRTLQDPTQNGMSCDFCDPYQFTALDDFGRIETPRVISASNLFKYCAPGHGLLVFRDHHPLEFDEDVIHDLMHCAAEWLERAAQQYPAAAYPLFVWNCLERAGASQFHGHAQIMLSEAPFPCYERLRAAQKSYSSMYPGKSYLVTLFEAYREVGLLDTLGTAQNTCIIYPSLTPWKDMEVVLWSRSLTTPAFHGSLSAVLRILIDRLGMRSFNVGIQGIPLDTCPSSLPEPSEVGGVMARVVSRGKLSTNGSDFGGLEVFGGASIGHMDPFEIKKAFNEEFQKIQSLGV